MSVITKDLGIASAYGYAKSKGYTGTEEEFAELMASYADVAQQAEAAAQDAEDAKDAAVSAKNDAVTAKTAAQAAQSAAETASGTASAKASEAAQSAQSAAGFASAAQTSATAASGSASTAQAAAQTATTKASEASSSASAASTAKTGAETARTGAQTAQAAAETAQANAEAAASSVSASAAQIEQNTEDIAGLKNDLNQFPSGNYPQMGAGYANQLVSGLKKEDQTPYNFRAVPYDATLEEVEKIVGGTIVNNQLVENGNFENASGWSYSNCDIAVANNELTMTTNGANLAGMIYRSGNFPVGHKMFVALLAKGTVPKMRVRYPFQSATIDITETYAPYAFVGAVTATEEISATRFSVQSVQDTLEAGKTLSLKYVMCTDLTQDFGTAIADYVYSLEQATSGAGVAWLKTHFPKQFNSGYQTYDAGSLQSVSGLTAHKTVGFNQWDEEWELGTIIPSNGQNASSSTKIRSKNYIPVIPSATYHLHVGSTSSDTDYVYFYDSNKAFVGVNYASHGATWDWNFTIPDDARYMRFIIQDTAYHHDICVNLSDPTKNGTYKPYEAHSYALDSDVVFRGIPKLDSNNRLYYDGDEYLPDGTVNRRYGIVDLGTLTWNKQTESDKVDRYYTSDISTVVLKPSVSTMLDLVCARFIASIDPVYGRTLDNAMCVLSSNGGLYISASGYTDASAFKTAMSGVYLVYAKQTPTTETADPYTTPQIISPDGTEEYIYEDGSFELPVGHSSEYPVDVSGQLDDILDTPSANGTYVLKATVTDGAVSYSWVADA